MKECRTWGDVHKRWRVHRMQGKLTCGTQENHPCSQCTRFGIREECCDGMEVGVAGIDPGSGYSEDCWRPMGTILVWSERRV